MLIQKSEGKKNSVISKGVLKAIRLSWGVHGPQKRQFGLHWWGSASTEARPQPGRPGSRGTDIPRVYSDMIFFLDMIWSWQGTLPRVLCYMELREGWKSKYTVLPQGGQVQFDFWNFPAGWPSRVLFFKLSCLAADSNWQAGQGRSIRRPDEAAVGGQVRSPDRSAEGWNVNIRVNKVFLKKIRVL